MTWTKVKPYDGHIYQGCLNCPTVEKTASLDTVVAVGFGEANISKDNKIVYRDNGKDVRTLAEFEDMAKKDPDHDWRLFLLAPLRGREYQRQGDNQWVLIDSNMGFAWGLHND
jgi:hypothetical protein